MDNFQISKIKTQIFANTEFGYWNFNFKSTNYALIRFALIRLATLWNRKMISLGRQGKLPCEIKKDFTWQAG